MRKRVSQYAAIAAAVVGAACADSTAPSTRTINSWTPTLAVLPIQVGPNIPAGTNWGDVMLCKQVSTGDPSTNSFSFSVTSTAEDASAATPPTNAAPGFSNVAPGTTNNCTIIYDADPAQGFGSIDRLVITEALQANWSVADIVVQQYAFSLSNPSNPPPRFAASVDPANRTATVRGHTEQVVVVTFINDHSAPPPPTGNQGCTPGFWKNNADKHGASQWPIPTTTTFASAFGANDDVSAGTTLEQALNMNGGGINALARHAAAAYLNSLPGAPNYQYTTAEVVTIVQNALNSNSYGTAQGLLATANERGCPLSQNGK
jgi:hypothetical protein